MRIYEDDLKHNTQWVKRERKNISLVKANEEDTVKGHDKRRQLHKIRREEIKRKEGSSGEKGRVAGQARPGASTRTAGGYTRSSRGYTTPP